MTAEEKLNEMKHWLNDTIISAPVHITAEDRGRLEAYRHVLETINRLDAFEHSPVRR